MKKTESQTKTGKVLIFPLFLALIISCLNPKLDCQKAAQENRQTECLLIFEDLPMSSPYLNARGKHLYTKKDCECEDVGRWWITYTKFLEKGDTIIKRKGELIFSIHKKDTVMNFNWECEGKFYQ